MMKKTLQVILTLTLVSGPIFAAINPATERAAQHFDDTLDAQMNPSQPGQETEEQLARDARIQEFRRGAAERKPDTRTPEQQKADAEGAADRFEQSLNRHFEAQDAEQQRLNENKFQNNPNMNKGKNKGRGKGKGRSSVHASQPQGINKNKGRGRGKSTIDSGKAPERVAQAQQINRNKGGKQGKKALRRENKAIKREETATTQARIRAAQHLDDMLDQSANPGNKTRAQRDRNARIEEFRKSASATKKDSRTPEQQRADAEGTADMFEQSMNRHFERKATEQSTTQP